MRKSALGALCEFFRREFAPIDMALAADEPEASTGAQTKEKARASAKIARGADTSDAPDLISERMARYEARAQAVNKSSNTQKQQAPVLAGNTQKKQTQASDKDEKRQANLKTASVSGKDTNADNLNNSSKSHAPRHKRACSGFVYIHPALIGLVIFALALGQGRVIALTICILAIHELAHIACARALGVPINRLRLTPLGAALELDPRLISPKQEGLIAGAGPLASAITVAVLCLLTGRGLDDSLLIEGAGIALALTLFNLLPASPLDGGRILHALIRNRLGERRASNICGALGFVLAALIMLCVLLSALAGVVPIMLMAASVCVYALAADEYLGDAQTAWQLAWAHRDELAGGACLPVRVLAVDADTPARALLGGLRRGTTTVYRVMDTQMRCMGEINETELITKCVDKPDVTAREII